MSEPKRPRLLAVGPAADASSYCRVLHGIFRHLSEDWEIHHLGINYRGEPRDDGWRILPNPSIGDRYGVEQIPLWVERLKPDVILLFNCFTVLPRYGGLAERLGEKRPKIVAYSPLMGEPLDSRRVLGLASFDLVVAFAPCVKRYFETCLDRFVEEGKLARRPPVEALPHGLDGDVFHPLPGGRKEAKRKLFGAGSEAGFVVLNANRYGTRKRIEITLEGFARFAEGKPPNVRLHLHMGEHADGHTVRDLLRRFGVESRVHLASTAPGGHPALTDEELNLLYNACDVGVNTASAEGWGMISFEHAATGAPQLVPGHWVCREIWEGYGEVLDLVAPPGRFESPLLKEGIVSPGSVAAALERLYGDHAYRAEMSERAIDNANRPEYPWRQIAKEWGRLLGDLLPTAVHEAPTGVHEPPTGAHGPLTGVHGPPTGVHGPPTGVHEPPTGVHGPPTGVHDAPTGVHEAPTGVQEPPTGAHEPPAGRSQPPAPRVGRNLPRGERRAVRPLSKPSPGPAGSLVLWLADS